MFKCVLIIVTKLWSPKKLWNLTMGIEKGMKSFPPAFISLFLLFISLFIYLFSFLSVDPKGNYVLYSPQGSLLLL